MFGVSLCQNKAVKILASVLIGLLVGCGGKKSVEPVSKRGQKTVTQNEGHLTSKSQVDAETTERFETKKKKSALEKKDLASQRPELVQKMKAIIKKARVPLPK